MSKEALKKAIKKWDDIIAGKGVDSGVDNCPLCALYEINDCEGCPVYERTNKIYCGSTPYTQWVEYMYHLDTSYPYSIANLKERHKSEAIELAKKERDFLESLLEGESSSYFLLLYDYDMGEWYFHGVLDDIEKAREIGSESCGYQIIKGERLEKVIYEEENDYI